MSNSTRLKEVLAIVNNKGGVGKTTTVQSLAAALVRQHHNYRILVVDLDPPGHLSLLHGWNPQEHQNDRTVYDALRRGQALPIYKSTREGVYLSPSSPELQEVDSDLFKQVTNPKMVLAKCFGLAVDDHTGEGFTTIIESFDYVFIDCAPALSQSTYNAMGVATGLLVPVQMEGLSVNGLGNIIVAMREVQSELNPNLELRGLLPTMVDARPRIVRDFIEYLKKSYGDNVCETLIHRSVKMNEAQTMLKDIYDYKQWCNVANDYDALVKELFGK